MKIIVIGAGISGLATAYTLQKNNMDVLVFEEGDYLNLASVEGSVGSGVEAAKNLQEREQDK
jgi:flavin-dependent dehydrogenase